MSFLDPFVEWRKSENIRPLSLPNKEKYYLDIQNIDYSFSGRIGEVNTNTFIMEAAQLLVNAIELFEMEYFDCAYFSLRSAIDVSTTMVFLIDLPEDDQEQWLNKWKNTEEFPMQHQMVKALFKSGYEDQYDTYKNDEKEACRINHKKRCVLLQHSINLYKRERTRFCSAG